MKTKEETLKEHIGGLYYFKEDSLTKEQSEKMLSAIHKAMEEYAKQEAEAFAEWKDLAFEFIPSKGEHVDRDTYIKRYNGEVEDSQCVFYSTSDLYAIFQKERSRE